MQKNIFPLVFLFILLLVVPMVDAQGFPCVIRGVVTVDGIPMPDVIVSVSPDSNDTTNSSGWYGVDAPCGANVTVIASYHDHSQTILVNTPAGGGFVNGQNIMILMTPTTNASQTPVSTQITQPVQETGTPVYLWIAMAGAGVILVATGIYLLIFKK